jgi:HAMP domain-containing protein
MEGFMELRFSIRYKILGVVTVLLIAAIGLYLLLAARIFKQDKSELVFELNKSVVTTLSTEVETTLRGAADKLKLYALIFGGEQSKRSQEGFKEIIAHDPLLVHVELFEMGSSKKMIMNSNLSEAAFLKLYNLDAAFFTDKLEISKPIPFEKIQKQSMYVWNATVKDGPALLGMGISVIRETNQGVPEKVMAAVGYLKADLFLQNLKTSKINQAFIIDPDGRVLVHTNSDYMIEGKDFSSSGIVNQLKSGQFASGVMEFRDGDKDELGAYAKINISGLGIISQVDKQKAFMAVQSLVRRSILFALIVITGTFIATVFFSRTLTRPLQKLLTAMERVARGELDTELVIKSGDEISVLAGSFNQMTKDLKQSRNSLQEINRDLESKVLDRTRKLEEQNRAVKEAQEALLRTTRLASVGEIAGRTAHEVLNPLTSLMARVTKIQKRLNDEIVGQKNLMSDIVAAWQSEYKSKGSEKFLKSLNEPSAIDPKMTLLQEDLGNISEVLKNWDQDLSTLGSDTSFLMQQASRIEKILGQMRNLSTISNVKSQVKIQSVVHDAVNVMADLFSKKNN